MIVAEKTDVQQTKRINDLTKTVDALSEKITILEKKLNKNNEDIDTQTGIVINITNNDNVILKLDKELIDKVVTKSSN